MRMIQLTMVCLAVIPATAGKAHAGLLTFEFDGRLGGTGLGPLANAGDTFRGTYTLETTKIPISHPDPSIDTQTNAIKNTLPGTGWTLRVNSTSISPFSISGDNAWIAIGDDTAFGDRYSPRLDNAPLPLGASLDYFQIDLQDPHINGADLLNSGSVGVVPNLSLASSVNARFYVTNAANERTQYYVNLTSLRAVPEPSTFALLGIGGLALAGYGWRRKRRRGESAPGTTRPTAA